MFSLFRRLVLRPRTAPVIVQVPALGRMEFDPAAGEWETVAGEGIYHGGIPGDVDGPDSVKAAQVSDRLGRIAMYWDICASDLLYIASCHASLPKVSDPRQLFRVAALSLYPNYWELCFETQAQYKWLYVGIQFDGDIPVSNTIDT